MCASLRHGFDLSAKRLDLVLVELNHAKDHIHLFVEYPPKVSISEMANALKGNSFFEASCGGAPNDALKLYGQSQQRSTVTTLSVNTQTAPVATRSHQPLPLEMVIRSTKTMEEVLPSSRTRQKYGLTDRNLRLFAEVSRIAALRRTRGTQLTTDRVTFHRGR